MNNAVILHKYEKYKNSGIEWIGEIPEHWSVNRGKNVLALLKREVENNMEVITCFRDGQVTLRSNRREDGFTFADKECGYQGIFVGDLVIHGMDGFAGAIGISDSNGKGSPVLNVCNPKSNYSVKYICYYLRMLASQNIFVAIATGIRERSCDLRWQKIANLLFILPTVNEQKEIADYLDKKCGEIDRIVETQKDIIEKLKEYKQSVITEAVTKGLDKSAPLKDSGIEWIGKIPQHWEIIALARIANIVRGASPRPAGDKKYFGGKFCPWITVAEVTKDETKYIIKTDEFLTELGVAKSKFVQNGTFLLSNSGATLGVPKITKISGCINDGSLAFLDMTCNQDFLYYVLKSRTNEFRKQMQGYGQPNLNTTIVKAFKICIPLQDEQKQITEYLDKKCSEIDSAISDKEQLVEKLTEYKKSLIYECVTGKRR